MTAGVITDERGMQGSHRDLQCARKPAPIRCQARRRESICSTTRGPCLRRSLLPETSTFLTVELATDDLPVAVNCRASPFGVNSYYSYSISCWCPVHLRFRLWRPPSSK